MINNESSIIVEQSDNVEKPLVFQRDAIARIRRKIIQRTRNILLIWLDDEIHGKNDDYYNTISQLRQEMNGVNMFTDKDECLQFINNITNTKVCMIIPDLLGKDIVPYVHNIAQVDSILVRCDDKKYDEQWYRDWPKVKIVFTEISSVCEVLQQVTQQYEQNAISISFVATDDGDDVSKKNLDQLDPIFMYSQILKEILLTITFDDERLKEFFDHCRTVFSNNDVQMRRIDNFQTEYHRKTPIWWYTCELFLYRMLNHALRVMDMDTIIKMGFFIKDLHYHIEKLHSRQFCDGNVSQIFTVYRGQGMSKTDFDQMRQNQGGLISFNNFLSTSQNRRVSLLFAESNGDSPDLVGILFKITVDPMKSTTPFACISDVGSFGDQEDEVLFSMHSVFRIGEIALTYENSRLFQVNLALTNDDDKALRGLTDHIRAESHPQLDGWYRLGFLLIKVGEYEKAQTVYQTLLEHTTNTTDQGRIFHQLGWATCRHGGYIKGLKFYEKALEIYKETLLPTDLEFTMCLNHIGLTCSILGDHKKALMYCEEAVHNREQSLPSNHPDLADSYSSLGFVYKSMGDYPRAHSYYEKSLEVRQQSLPSNHPDLAASYNNVGITYVTANDYSKALSYYEKSIQIRKQSLPSNHPDLADSTSNIGAVFHNLGDYPKALLYYEKSTQIRKQLLPSNHPDFATSYSNIGRVYSDMCNYPKALSFHEKALEIR